MIKDFYYNIVNGLNVKENLLSLKETLKTPIKGSREKDALLSILNGDFSVLTELLKNEDPKIRKNTAIVLGILEAPENLDALYEAYTTDIVMYNKATYVEALRKIGYEKYKDELKARFEELKKIPVDDENRKHVVDEMKQLVKIFGNGKLVFAGFSLENECIFTTNRSHKEVTGDQIKKLPHKDFPSGIIFKTKALEDVIHIRTYDELLFVPDGARTVSADPKKAAKELFDAGIKEYIFKRVLIKGEETEQSNGYRVNFRTELRSKDKQKAADFAKKFSEELELLTNWGLSNSVSNYDVEIRFVETSSDKLIVLVKFCILKDDRFTYRRETIAATIKPYLAATLMQLAKPYLKGNATVLDPFCGVGTMIAERELAVNAKRYYGIDIFGEAVKKAEINLKSAGVLKKTDLINKDFFEFKSTHLFDEIITDMPFVTDQKSLFDIEKIYEAFFDKADELLDKKAVIIMYSRNPEFVKEYSHLSNCNIKEDFEISKKDNSHLFVLAR